MQPRSTSAGGTTRPSTDASSATDDVARLRGARRPPCGRCPRGCRTCPAGSARACRCRASSAAVGEAVQPVADEPRPHLALDRDVGVGRDQVEHAALEHVGAGRDQVRVELLVARRLLDELEHRVVVAAAHEPVGGRVLDRNQRERAVAPVASCWAIWAVRSRSVRTSPLSIRKRSSRRSSAYFSAPAVPRGSGSSTKRSRTPYARAVAEHVAHARRQEAARHDDVVDAVAVQPLEHVGDERPVDERHDRLGDRRGQRAQPRPLAADEDHRLHRTYRPMPS